MTPVDQHSTGSTCRVQPARSETEKRIRDRLFVAAVHRGHTPDALLISRLAKELARTGPAGVSRT